MADQEKIEGAWSWELGAISLKINGNKVEGTLLQDSHLCPFKKGVKVLQGTIEEDTLSGKMRVCLQKKCPGGSQWHFILLILGKNGKKFKGAISSKCPLKLKRQKSVILTKQRAQKSGKKTKSLKANTLEMAVDLGKKGRTEPGKEHYNPLNYKIKSTEQEILMQEAGNYLSEGYFERARKLFIKVIQINPARVEAYNGVGVTFYARKELKKAEKWYKKSLDIDPDFPDAYYNLACIYALMDKSGMAIQFLKISLLNGYIDVQNINQDPDLQSIITQMKKDPLLKKYLVK